VSQRREILQGNSEASQKIAQRSYRAFKSRRMDISGQESGFTFDEILDQDQADKTREEKARGGAEGRYLT